MDKHSYNKPAAYGEYVNGMIIAGHYHETDTYLTKRPNGRSDWLITYTLEGEGRFITPGREDYCSKGDLTLLRHGTPHQYGTRSGRIWNFVWAHFSSRIVETNLLPDMPLFIHAVDNDSAHQRIYQAFRRVISDSIERSAYWSELCENNLREILLLIAQRESKPIDARIEETQHLLSTNMAAVFRIDELARKVGLSPSRLSHLYKETIGVSIVESLNQMRIRQAALMLEHTNRNASEVALDVGFQNYNHFANQFRKHYGVSPRAYQSGRTRKND
ncbi:helix-turn-helix domain-containing protein [Paenibacillus solisilvae]|uniref:Helix-turn-helix domain-containing protein n=1 Tax=Paenibacillus solisilvae TaxID=2486751 RepID=A0ABW0VTR1_9BACL